jgi:hypothetical protein
MIRALASIIICTTPFIMNSSQLSNEDSNIKLFKVFNKLKNAQHSKISNKELKKVKQEKKSLIVQLSESHLLKKFSIDNLKSMLCIHSGCF